jgi:hypothetical protein
MVKEKMFSYTALQPYARTEDNKSNLACMDEKTMIKSISLMFS